MSAGFEAAQEEARRLFSPAAPAGSGGPAPESSPPGPAGRPLAPAQPSPASAPPQKAAPRGPAPGGARWSPTPYEKQRATVRDHLFMFHGASYGSTAGADLDKLELWHEKRPAHLHELEMVRDHLFMRHGQPYSSLRQYGDLEALETLHKSLGPHVREEAG